MNDPTPTSTCGPVHVTRLDALIFYRDRAIRETRFTAVDFAVAIAHAYHRLVPEHARSIELTPPDESASHVVYAKGVERLRTQVKRYVIDSLHLPVVLEEAWVSALPEPYAGDCRAALARRYGFLGAMSPEAAPCTDGEAVGRVMTETGECLSVLSQALADGRIDADDLRRLPHLLKEIRDAQAALASVEARVLAVQAGTSTVAQIGGADRG